MLRPIEPALKRGPSISYMFCSRTYVATWLASGLEAVRTSMHMEKQCKSHRGSAQGGKPRSWQRLDGLRLEELKTEGEPNSNVVDRHTRLRTIDPSPCNEGI